MKDAHGWQGFFPPQRIFSKRRFAGIALDPPDMEPGSWIGAGKAVFDAPSKTFLLTARPRKAAGNVRGYEANIYSSRDGVRYKRICGMTRENVLEKSGVKVHSIEGTQLLRDPLTDRWHFYLSVDTGKDFVWGGLEWETMLFTAEDFTGPWESEGIVLSNDQEYDAGQARDSTIDIVDGRWLCLYKAKNAKREERPALATSRDGIQFQKHGVLTVDGEDRICFLSGSLFAAAGGILFIGLEHFPEDSLAIDPNEEYADEHKVGHGGGPPANFVAMLLDTRNRNLETIFRTRWVPLSEYEWEEHPLLGYASLVEDPHRHRMLMYVEAIDKRLTKAIGLNTTVERLLVYECPLG